MKSVVAALLVAFARGSSQCNSMISWMPSFAIGIDIASVEPINPDKAPFNLRPVLKFTCDQNKSWFDTLTGNSYPLPDQLDTPDLDPGSSTQAATLAASTADSLVESAFEMISEESCGLLSCSSASQSSSALLERMFNGSAFMSFAKSEISTYQVTTGLPPLPNIYSLDDNAAIFYNDTIGKAGVVYNESTRAAYDEFRSAFGTHFISEAGFGCRAQAVCIVEQTAFRIHGEASAEAQGSIDLLSWIKGGGSGGGHSSGTASWWQQASVCNYSTVGPAIGGSVQEWQKECGASPALHRFKLTPISMLLPTTEQQDNFDAYIKDYTHRVYLQRVLAPAAFGISSNKAYVTASGALDCSAKPQCAEPPNPCSVVIGKSTETKGFDGCPAACPKASCVYSCTKSAYNSTPTGVAIAAAEALGIRSIMTSLSPAPISTAASQLEGFGASFIGHGLSAPVSSPTKATAAGDFSPAGQCGGIFQKSVSWSPVTSVLGSFSWPSEIDLMTCPSWLCP